MCASRRTDMEVDGAPIRAMLKLGDVCRQQSGFVSDHLIGSNYLIEFTKCPPTMGLDASRNVREVIYLPLAMFRSKRLQ